MNLRSKLISLIIPLVMGASLCIGISVYSYLYHEYKKIMINESSVLLRQIQSSVDNYSENIEKQLNIIASDSNVRKLTSSKDGDELNFAQAEFSNFLSLLKNQYPSIIDFYVIDSNGTIQSTKTIKNIYWHKLLIQKIEQHNSNSFKMPIFINNRLMSTYIHKINSNGASNLGYIILLDDYNYFDTLLSKAVGFEDNFILLANKYEIIRNPNGFIGADEFIDKISEDSFFMIKFGITRFNNTEFFYYMIPQERGNSIISFMPTTDFRNTAKSRGIVIIAISFLLSLGISMFLVSFINKIVVIPIRKIDYMSQEMAKENFSITIDELETTDEIGGLYKSFINMNDSLSASINRINEIAHYDELTGLPNRRSLNSMLKEYIARADNSNSKVSVFMMDVDDFKEVNDIHGHHIGDELLKEISSRMLHSTASLKAKHPNIKCEVCRLAGDEFTLIAGNYVTDDIIPELAEKVIESFEKPFILEHNCFKVSISLGISTFPKDGDDRHILLKYADMAMYEAKLNGKNRFAEFNSEMKDRLKDRKDFERKIISAIENDDFLLHYQPKVSTKNNCVTEFEALIRWTHPTDGQISPAKFIPFSEENGLIDKIGMWVFENLCKDISLLYRLGWKNFKISFNTSPQQLQNIDYTKNIEDCLLKYSINPNNIEMEITEYSLAKDITEAVRHLNKIKSLGISIAIDDFGTGYSSLSYLEKLPIDTLKIDKSFISEAGSSKSKLTIIATIVTLAKGLGLQTVAEGVETSEENEIAKNYGCDFIQGYYHYKPMKLSEIEQFTKDII